MCLVLESNVPCVFKGCNRRLQYYNITIWTLYDTDQTSCIQDVLSACEIVNCTSVEVQCQVSF